jgi:hypothetical protein
MPLQHHKGSAQIYQNVPQIHPHPTSCTGLTVYKGGHIRLFIAHIKMLKHVLYIQCGCGMQSEVSVNLNNNMTTSLRLRYFPKSMKLNPPPPISIRPKWRKILNFLNKYVISIVQLLLVDYSWIGRYIMYMQTL